MKRLTHVDIYQIIMALIGLVVTVFGLYIGYQTYKVSQLSYIDTKQNNRLVEIREFIAMSEEQQDAYLAARKDD